MSSATPSPLELRLSAFVDSQTSDHERHDLEELLVNDPQARALHDVLKRGGDIGRSAFDDLCKEPVPLDLVRTIRNAPLPRKAIRLPEGPRAPFAFKPTGLQTLGTCLLLFMLGGGFGYMLGGEPSASAVTGVETARDSRREWLDDIIASYRLYARQTNHLVEVPAERPADILEWLTTNTGVTFRIPDLSDSGLKFIGARLVTAGNAPVGQLFYRRTEGDGDVIAISFTRARGDATKPIEEIRNETGVVSWVTPLATYLVVGPSAAADLDDIASKAAGLI